MVSSCTRFFCRPRSEDLTILPFSSAPYVPRLTEPFIRTLDFPGAIFVGIHDDGTPNGLAAVVRKNMPEDSTIVDLDSGTVDCSGDR